VGNQSETCVACVGNVYPRAKRLQRGGQGGIWQGGQDGRAATRYGFNCRMGRKNVRQRQRQRHMDDEIGMEMTSR
jgi:hypothetical protein